MFKSTLVRKITIGLLLVLFAVVSGACQDDAQTSQELSSDSESATTEDSESATTEDSFDYSWADAATSDSFTTEDSFDYSWANDNTYIAHALGGGTR